MYKRFAIAVMACLALSACQTTTATWQKVNPKDLSFELRDAPALTDSKVIETDRFKREVGSILEAGTLEAGVIYDELFQGGYLNVDSEILSNWVKKYAENPSNTSENKSIVLPLGRMAYVTFTDGLHTCILGLVNVGARVSIRGEYGTKARLTLSYCAQMKLHKSESKGLALFKKLRLKNSG